MVSVILKPVIPTKVTPAHFLANPDGSTGGQSQQVNLDNCQGVAVGILPLPSAFLARQM